MSDDTSEWEAIGRQLLHDELTVHAQERLESAMDEVATDIKDGEQLPAKDVDHLGAAFYEVLHTIDEFVVPLVDDPEKVRWEFELEAEELDEMPNRADLDGESADE